MKVTLFFHKIKTSKIAFITSPSIGTLVYTILNTHKHITQSGIILCAFVNYCLT